MNIRKLLKRLPYPIKHRLRRIYGLIPLSIRYGKVFRDTYKFLQESQWWSKERLEEYQMQQLEKLLKHSYENVPYYQRIFNERGLKPKDIQCLNDLKKLPYLTKEIIRKNKEEFVSRTHSETQLEPAYTGGSTGSPLHFYYEKGVTAPREMAFVWRMWNRYGYTWKDKCFVMTGGHEPPEKIFYDSLENCLYLFNPSFNLNNIKEYIKLIENFKPKIIRGYPSIIYLFAHILLRSSIKKEWPFIKLVYCFSEKIFDFQRKEIKKAFGCKLYEQYGHNERLVFMSQCEENEYYHIMSEYGITEIISPHGQPIVEEGESGEIVGTGFNNYAFPMIRYKTGDWAGISKKNCKCGRVHPLVKEVIGRSGDFILTPSGKFVSPTIIEFAIVYIKNFKDIQLVQTNLDTVDIKIVPDTSYTEEEGKKFAAGVKTRIGAEMKTRVMLVNEIERPPNQKRRFVKSDISKQFLEANK